VIWAIVRAPWYPNREIFALALAWSGYSMVLLWLSLQASLDVPQRSSALRFKHELPGFIRHRGIAVPIVTSEISDVDVVLDRELPGIASDGLTLSIPRCGLHDVPVSIAEEEGDVARTVKLGKLSVAQQRALVSMLYCRPGQWDERGVPERVTFWHFLEAPFRMFPLAETR